MQCLFSHWKKAVDIAHKVNHKTVVPLESCWSVYFVATSSYSGEVKDKVIFIIKTLLSLLLTA